MHQYLKTKLEAPETKRLLYEEMSWPIPLNQEAWGEGGWLKVVTASTRHASLFEKEDQRNWMVICWTCCKVGQDGDRSEVASLHCGL